MIIKKSLKKNKKSTRKSKIRKIGNFWISIKNMDKTGKGNMELIMDKTGKGNMELI